MSIRFVDYPEPEVKHGLFEIGASIFWRGGIMVIDEPAVRIPVAIN